MAASETSQHYEGATPPSRLRRVGGLLLRIAGLVAALVAVRLAGGVLTGIGIPQLPAAIVTAALMLGTYYGGVRLLERRKPTELGREGAVREWAAGALLGVGLFVTMVTILWVFGAYQLDGFNPFSVVWAAVSTHVLASVLEELLFRGVLFRILEESLGSWIALALSAAVFGAIHLVNPGATLIGAVALALQAGVLLGLAYMVTRRLWMAIGLHMAWNITQAAIFGLTTSGVGAKGLLDSSTSGPTLLSGGSMGVEGSLITVLVCLAATVVLAVRVYRSGRILPPSWRRQVTAAETSAGAV